MLIAIISDPNHISVNTPSALFPNTSFPESGPNAEFMAHESCLYAYDTLPFDPATQILQSVPPYIDGDAVYTVLVREMTPEEQEQYDESLRFQNKAKASSLLAATDWVDIPAVSDPANNPHLANRDAFNSYRLQLRAIAVNPPVTVDPWPVKPEEVWVSN